MICHLAYEFHLAPSVVLAESDRMQVTMLRYLRWRGIKEREAQRGNR
jgi:hypothetical protein